MATSIDFLPPFFFFFSSRPFFTRCAERVQFYKSARIKVNPRARARSAFNRVFTVIAHTRNHTLYRVYVHATRINISIRATCATACANPPFKSFLLAGEKRKLLLTREFLVESTRFRARNREGERVDCNLKKERKKERRRKKLLRKEGKACGNFERMKKKKEKSVFALDLVLN